MKRLASEIIRDLELRVANLEKKSFGDIPWDDFVITVYGTHKDTNTGRRKTFNKKFKGYNDPKLIKLLEEKLKKGEICSVGMRCNWLIETHTDPYGLIKAISFEVENKENYLGKIQFLMTFHMDDQKHHRGSMGFNTFKMIEEVKKRLTEYSQYMEGTAVFREVG
mgnify:CR=1 FL=1